MAWTALGRATFLASAALSLAACSTFEPPTSPRALAPVGEPPAPPQAPAPADDPTPPSPAVANTARISDKSPPGALSANRQLPDKQGQKPTLFLRMRAEPGGTEPYRHLPSYYVRLMIEPQSADAHEDVGGGEAPRVTIDRDYEYERRDVIKRLIWGRSWSVNLAVELKVPSRGIDLKLPLMVWSHGSNATVGEVWLTEVSGSRLMNGYFLASPDTTMQIGLVHTQASEVSTEAIRTAVNAARTILEVADPGVKAITVLSNAKLNQASSAIDRTLGQLFSSSLEERLTNSYTVSRMLGANPLVFESGVPGDEWRDASSYRWVGTWKITLSAPKPSIFSAVEYCESGTAKTDTCVTKETEAVTAVMKDADPHAVLATKVAAEKSIGEFLAQAPWYATLFPLIKTATDDNQLDALGGICSATLQEMANLPLSTLDGKIVLWAVLKTSALTPSALDAATKRAECAAALSLASE